MERLAQVQIQIYPNSRVHTFQLILIRLSVYHTLTVTKLADEGPAQASREQITHPDWPQMHRSFQSGGHDVLLLLFNHQVMFDSLWPHGP